MLLFVMAFVGNSLYVLSILTNPLMSSPGYLLESTPYLMGSGEFRFRVSIWVSLGPWLMFRSPQAAPSASTSPSSCRAYSTRANARPLKSERGVVETASAYTRRKRPLYSTTRWTLRRRRTLRTT